MPWGPLFQYQAKTEPVSPFQDLESRWHQPWSNPVVLIKIGLLTALQQAVVQCPTPPIIATIKYLPLSEPVRFKQGLSYTLQQFLAYHPRLIPKPNVTATLATREIDSDAAIITISVLQSGPAVSAKVSISEVGGGGSATSVREPQWP